MRGSKPGEKRGSYKSKYKLEVLRLMDAGYTDKQIVERTGCNIKYPSVMRCRLSKMTHSERQALMDEAKEVKKPEAVEAKQAVKKQSFFNTPYKAAKTRSLISRY